MLICQAQGCICFHHRLLECIDKELNDEAQLLLQKIEKPCDLADAQGKSLLHYSAQYDNATMVQHMIEKGCKPDDQDNRGVTPLMLAVESANVPITEILIQNNADIYIADSDGVSTMQRSFYVMFDSFTADYEVQLFSDTKKESRLLVLQMIFDKVKTDFLSDKEATINLLLNFNNIVKLAVVALADIELASLILERGYPIEFREPKLGLTALHCTSILEKSENAELLIERKANIEAADNTGVTPLMLAVRNGNVTIVKILLKNNADIYVTYSNGTSALECSFYINVHLRKATFRQFLTSFARERENHRLTLDALIEKTTQDFLTDREMAIKLLIDANYIVKLAIIAFCNTELAAIILQNDYPMEFHEPKLGLTALHCASILGKFENAKFLIEHGANVHATDKTEVTPLMLAIKNGFMSITEILLKNNANVLATDNHGVCALQHSLYVNLNLPEWIVFLRPPMRKKQRPGFEMIVKKINEDFSADNEATIKSLLNVNSNVKLAIVASCNIELASIVLQKGLYSIDFRESQFGFTALHCAMSVGKIENVKFLIEKGANIDVLDRSDNSPLYYYTHIVQFMDEKSEVLKIFLKRSSILYRVFDNFKTTDITHLLQMGTKETVKTTLLSGIDIAAALHSRSLQYVLMKNENLKIIDIIDLGIRIDANLFISGIDSSILMSQAFSGNVDKVEYLLELGADVNFTSPRFKTSAIWEAATSVSSKNKYDTVELLLQFNAGTVEILCNLVQYFSETGQQEQCLSKLFVAQLAILAAINDPLPTETVHNNIFAVPTLKSYYNLCLKQLKDLKDIVLYDTVTMFDILHVKYEQFIKPYARNQEFYMAFKHSLEKMTHLESYYINTLQRRVTSAVRKAKIENKMAQIIKFVNELSDEELHISVCIKSFNSTKL